MFEYPNTALSLIVEIVLKHLFLMILLVNVTRILHLHDFHLTVVTKGNVKVLYKFATHLLSIQNVKRLPQISCLTAPELKNVRFFHSLSRVI